MIIINNVFEILTVQLVLFRTVTFVCLLICFSWVRGYKIKIKKKYYRNEF